MGLTTLFIANVAGEIFDSMPQTPRMVIGSNTKGTKGMGELATNTNTSSSRKILAIEG